MVTNDGATILKNIGVDNPAAKVLVGESENNKVSLTFWNTFLNKLCGLLLINVLFNHYHY